MPTQNLRGFAEKVALVSDAGNEIGRAVALQLALQGCYVIAGFSNITEKNKRALTELQSLGTLANAVEADISTVEGAKFLVDESESLYGRRNLLLYTADVKHEYSLAEKTEI